MKKALRFVKFVIKFIVLPLVLLVVAVGLWLVYLAKTRLPDLDAVVTHPSLQGEVRVVRDQWGVPHVYAENEPDAYFALGYAMAQDRLFQMELVLRLARGELAEIARPSRSTRSCARSVCAPRPRRSSPKAEGCRRDP